MSTIFQKIIDRQIPAAIVFEDDRALAFRDINPQAPHHTLICPRVHMSTLNELTARDEPLMGHVVRVAADLAKQMGDAEEGYRLVANCQRGAGQSVFHVHFHLMGGRTFGWPPG